MNLFDPPPTDEEYWRWDRTATRPLTDPAMGNPGRRRRDAQLSARVFGYERPRREEVLIKSPWTKQLYLVKR